MRNNCLCWKKCYKKYNDRLKNLEYRGYDSAGIAYINKNKVVIKKEQGKISNLEKVLII